MLPVKVRASVAVVGCALVAFSTSVRADPPFSVTKLVEGGAGKAYLEVLPFSHGFALNDDGDYVFAGRKADGTRGLFTGPDPVADAFILESARYTGYGYIDLANGGNIAFNAGRTGGGRDILAGNIHAGSGTLRTIVNTGTAADVYSDINGYPAINSSGLAAVTVMRKDGTQAIVKGLDPVADALVDSTGPFAQFGGQPRVNDAGTLAFQAVRDDGVAGVYTGPNPAADTYKDTSASAVPAFIRPDIDLSSNGTLLYEFRTEDPDGGHTVFATGPDLMGDHVATGNEHPAPGQYEDFAAARAVNDNGLVVFGAFWNTGPSMTSGLFDGPDPARDCLLKLGDSLFGSTVNGFDTNAGSLNDHDQLLFWYRLTDGTSGLAMMQLPEPTSAAAVLLSGAVMGLLRRRGR